MFKALHMAIACVALTGLFATSSNAQMGGGGPIDECVATMRTQTERTIGVIGNITRAGVMRITALANEGASKAALAKSARQSIREIRRVSHEGARAVNETTRRCLDFLHNNNFPPEAARFVLQARGRSLHAIARGARHGVHAVLKTLHDAAQPVSTDVGPVQPSRSI